MIVFSFRVFTKFFETNIDNIVTYFSKYECSAQVFETHSSDNLAVLASITTGTAKIFQRSLSDSNNLVSFIFTSNIQN